MLFAHLKRILKLDRLRTAAKDDHVVVYVMGNFKAPDGPSPGGGPVVDKVLAVSATTDYEHSGGENLLVTTAQPDGGPAVDIESTWLTDWANENATENPT